MDRSTVSSVMTSSQGHSTLAAREEERSTAACVTAKLDRRILLATLMASSVMAWGLKSARKSRAPGSRSIFEV